MAAPGMLERVAVAVLCLMLASSMLVTCVYGRGAPTPLTATAHAADTVGRTVDYQWYDFFDVSYGEWWEYRVDWYGNDVPTTDSFPYLNRHFYNLTHFDTYSGARLNITARSLPEVNMGERPVFLPLLSGEDGARGGNAVIDWYMQYLTLQEYLDRGYPVPSTTFMDGWVISLNGTVRLDEAGAMSVMGITSDDFDDFATWWESNGTDFEYDYVDWILYEGRDRLDIFSMYDFSLVPLVFNLLAQKVGDEIVLTYDAAGLGFEALMTRWLRDAFMPTEWWFEDFTMHAEIGPDMADLDIDTAVVYALKAWGTNEGAAPCWAWQGMLQDHLPTGVYHDWLSDFDDYYGKYLLCKAPGSPWYGYMIDYRYTPGCHNLSEGESMSFEWPEEEVLFLEHAGPLETVNTTSKSIVQYSEPMASDIGERVDCSPGARTITFQGPIDFWSWSESQNEHEYLYDEWQRLGVLPWGMPYIELTAWLEDTPPIAYLQAERSTNASSASQYVLNASQSADSEDALEDLEFRWDLDGDGTMDTDWSSEPQVEIDFGGAGTFTVSVSVKDTDNMTALASAEVTVPEVNPPVTDAYIVGVEGDNGWFASAVTVTMASDDDSGVAATKYRLDGLEWELYSGEFTVTSDGDHTLEFYSVDVESNYEEVQETALKVDSTPPTASFITDLPEFESGNITVDWSSSDETSGVAYTSLALDGGPQLSMGSATSHTLQGLEEGDHTLVLTVYDQAGNSASDTYTFSVGGTTVAGGPEWLPIVAIFAALVAAVVIGVLLLTRRKPSA